MKKKVLILAMCIMTMFCAAAYAVSYNVNTYGTLGPNTTSCSIGVEGSGPSSRCVLKNNSQHLVEKIGIDNINIIVSPTVYTVGASVTKNSSFTASYSMTIGDTVPTNASGRFWVTSGNFGGFSRAFSY